MNTKACPGCNQQLPLANFSKDKYRKDGVRRVCKACSASQFFSFKNSEHYAKRLAKVNEERKRKQKESPVAHWAHIAFHNAKRRAKDLGVEFSITKDWLIANAPEFCPLLEVRLQYGASKSFPDVASIDRLDFSGGYTPNNCKIISFKANRIKNNATQQELKLLVKNMQGYY